MRKKNYSYSRRSKIDKTKDPRFQINTSYEKSQLEKIAASGELKINEGNQQEAALVIVRTHIIDILEFNNITVNLECLKDLIKEFQYRAIADIKSHEIVNAYYKIEDLHKYLLTIPRPKSKKTN